MKSEKTSSDIWLENIFDTLGNILLGYLKTILKDEQQAEDVMQNVFIRLFHAHQKGQKIDNERAFIFTIAYREACRQLQKKRWFGFSEKIEKIFEAKEDKSISPLQVLTLEEALLYLPKEQRQVVYLKIYGELTFDEIGKAMHCSTNTAASRYRYGLEKMRDFLGENYGTIRKTAKGT